MNERSGINSDLTEIATWNSGVVGFIVYLINPLTGELGEAV